MMCHRSHPVIAIDGPAGAGKSTVAKLVAQSLGFVHLNTGAIYRAVAFKVSALEIDPENRQMVTEVAKSLHVEFRKKANGHAVLYLDAEDCSDRLQVPEISSLASKISSYKGVRDALLGIQRKLGDEGAIVLEGRDIGTVVFPDAEVKIFLTASAEVRAHRRCLELQSKGVAADETTILQEIQSRDERDQNRVEAPLVPASDAIEIDTSHLSIDGAVQEIVKIARVHI